MRISDSTVTLASSRTHLEHTRMQSAGQPKTNGLKDQSLGFYQNLFNQPLKQTNNVSSRISAHDAISSIRMHLLHMIFDYLRGGGIYNASNVYDISTGQVVSDGSYETQVSAGSIWVRTPISSFEYHEEESTSFVSAGIVKTADGREIDFGVELSMTRSFTQVFEQYTNKDYFVTDPLVINIDSDITSVSDFKFMFDLDCDGTKERISFAGAGSGFLALDLNDDGIINDGSELFGTKSGNGFADLAKYDSDANGWIDEADEIFDRLKVWTKDENGKDKLISLRDADVGAIYLGHAPTQFSLNDSFNRTNAYIRSTGIFLHESGSVGTLAQLDLTS